MTRVLASALLLQKERLNSEASEPEPEQGASGMCMYAAYPPQGREGLVI
eukprot:CAMPEP_0202358342 /NCGR_PEP_ID=MMETSP1126-20121109/12041_1 /ASSEMBLY_ACC=CAM_ASM_000457 /TAXON_ID=3047 /ORGANISM="Dunaliella tertiolecta, Strain CCMP1320" /LENGTH=48 /DNA_ID= /DNA_START= /DNA_END= /DNA_ORIENTATION=